MFSKIRIKEVRIRENWLYFNVFSRKIATRRVNSLKSLLLLRNYYYEKKIIFHKSFLIWNKKNYQLICVFLNLDVENFVHKMTKRSITIVYSRVVRKCFLLTALGGWLIHANSFCANRCKLQSLNPGRLDLKASRKNNLNVFCFNFRLDEIPKKFLVMVLVMIWYKSF